VYEDAGGARKHQRTGPRARGGRKDAGEGRAERGERGNTHKKGCAFFATRYPTVASRAKKMIRNRPPNLGRNR
jgi:hypothetical protein